MPERTVDYALVPSQPEGRLKEFDGRIELLVFTAQHKPYKVPGRIKWCIVVLDYGLAVEQFCCGW